MLECPHGSVVPISATKGLIRMSRKTSLKHLFLLALLLGTLAPPPAHAAVIYVNGQMKTSGTGASWSEAKRTIGEAVDQATTGTQTQIWVAEGIYAEAITMKNKMELYGGFVGTETILANRNPLLHPTIIDASEISKKEDTSTIYLGYLVNNTKIDGFIITGGNGLYGGGVACGNEGLNTITNCVIIGNHGLRGGGIGFDDVVYPPFITNCTITSNTATVGGGISYSLYPYSPRPASQRDWISNCQIVGNSVFGNGGGISIEHRDHLAIKNCLLSYNKASYGYYDSGGFGGGIYCDASSVDLANCTLTHNRSQGEGGGLFCIYESNPSIVNTIFYGNGNFAIYEALSPYWNDEGDFEGSYPDSDPSVRSCLFEANPDGDYLDEGANAYTGAWQIQQHVPEVQHCVDGDPLFVGAPSGQWTQAPTYDAAKKRTTLTDGAARFKTNELAGRLILIDEAQGTVGYIMANDASTIQIFGDWSQVLKVGQSWKLLDWHVKPNSPAVDMGTPWLAPSDDLDGNPRPIDTPLRGAERTGNEYDIGAYEVQVRRNAMEGEWTLYR